MLDLFLENGLLYLSVGAIVQMYRVVYALRYPWRLGIRPNRELWGLVVAGSILGILFFAGLAVAFANLAAWAEWSPPLHGALLAAVCQLVAVPVIIIIAQQTLDRIPIFGVAILRVLESVNGIDHEVWGDINRSLKQTMRYEARRARILLRSHTEKLFQQHRDRIRNHMRLQSKLAWLFGGPYFHPDQYSHLNTVREHNPVKAKLLLYALGSRRLQPYMMEIDEERRCLEREPNPNGAQVVLVPPGGERLAGHVADQSVIGCRIRLRGNAVEQIEDLAALFPRDAEVEIRVQDQVAKAHVMSCEGQYVGLRY